MLLSRELPDYTYSLRSADGHQARVNDQTLQHSFVLAPNQLIENWPVTSARTLTPEHLDAALAQDPELVILATGEKQVFPAPAVMAACLTISRIRCIKTGGSKGFITKLSAPSFSAVSTK